MTIVFLAEGFEEIEAVTPVDILRRGGVDVKTCSITPGERTVTGAHGVPFVADLAPEDLPQSLDCVILPGGMPGTLNLKESDLVRERLIRTKATGGVVAAICAAPTVLSAHGLLRGEAATCYPGMEGELDCARFSREDVVISGRVITSRGAGTAAAFGFALLAMFRGREEADRIRSAMCYAGRGER